MSEKPIIGAAMRAEHLKDYADWILTEQRDLEIQDPALPDFLDGNWQQTARQIREALAGYQGRLGIHGPYNGLTLNASDAKVRALVADRYRQALEFGDAVGATHMVIHSPYIFLGDPFVPHSPTFERNGDQLDYARQTLETVLSQAIEADCVLVIENILDKNSGPLLQLIRSFESDYVRLSIDTGHAFVTHCQGGQSPDQWVRDAGSLLAHLHIQDSDGLFDRHWVPGQGNLNWYALFEALELIPNPPRMVLELRDRSHIFQAAAWLAEQGWVR